jgi:hypothetical protein
VPIASRSSPMSARRSREWRSRSRSLEGVAAARRLGLVHRDVGALEQRLGVLAVLGEDGDADARADAHVDAVDREALLERARDPVPDGIGVGGVGEDDGELVAAQPRELVASSCSTSSTRTA